VALRCFLGGGDAGARSPFFEFCAVGGGVLAMGLGFCFDICDYEAGAILAPDKREDFKLLLLRYGVERLLYRLSISPHADKFILKGATLFLVWKGQSYPGAQGCGPAVLWSSGCRAYCCSV
jgi:hypothetical protein